MRMGQRGMHPRDADAVRGTKLERDTVRRAWRFARPYRTIIIV
ncbi:MAG: hypothetical protein JWM12_1842, partial [Ilumatobacteraceae bacterium]|nr:hypothetical protein [Ilumatobacteraceae bacterium]